MIGRGKGNHLETFVNLSQLCRKHNVKFKVNTVVCRYNIDEDMNAMLEKVAPFRWKCFQVLVIEGENDSSTTLRVCMYLNYTLSRILIIPCIHAECSTLHHLQRRISNLPRPAHLSKSSRPRTQRRDEKQLCKFSCLNPPLLLSILSLIQSIANPRRTHAFPQQRRQRTNKKHPRNRCPGCHERCLLG